MNDEYYKQIADMFAKKDVVNLRKLITYDPWVFTVTPEYNEQYLYAGQEYDRRYFDDTGLGPALVCPGLILNQSLLTRSPSFHLMERMASVHSSDELEWVNPPRVGKTFTVNWSFDNVYEKRGKTFSSVVATITDQDNNVILRRTAHGIFMGDIILTLG
jgi:hypothetical protein